MAPKRGRGRPRKTAATSIPPLVPVTFSNGHTTESAPLSQDVRLAPAVTAPRGTRTPRIEHPTRASPRTHGT